MERNRCWESGCRGYCCQDIDLEATIFERRRIFPMATRVNTILELGNIKGRIQGVFYARYRRKHLGEKGFVVVAINGPCPNRLTNGGCSVHAEREHAAGNFAIGNPECNVIRAEHGLTPVFIEPVE